MKMLTRRETRKAASRWAAEARKAAAEHEEAIRAARTPEDYQAAIAAARKTAADFQAEAEADWNEAAAEYQEAVEDPENQTAAFPIPKERKPNRKKGITGAFRIRTGGRGSGRADRISG